MPLSRIPNPDSPIPALQRQGRLAHHPVLAIDDVAASVVLPPSSEEQADRPRTATAAKPTAIALLLFVTLIAKPFSLFEPSTQRPVCSVTVGCVIYSSEHPHRGDWCICRKKLEPSEIGRVGHTSPQVEAVFLPCSRSHFLGSTRFGPSPAGSFSGGQSSCTAVNHPL